MIRINLLPVREARRKADMQQQLMLIGLVAGASFVLCVLVHFAVLASISSAEGRVGQLNAQISEFQVQLKQVEDFKKKASEIEKKLDVIHRLELSRNGPVRLLDELALRTPQKLWIKSLQAEGNRIQLKGMSLDTELIADFLNQLNESKYLKDVELKNTELSSETGGLKLNSFQVSAVLTSPEAEAADSKKSAPVVPTPATAPADTAKKG
jgi:type IV pilus assembly protein PilN